MKNPQNLLPVSSSDDQCSYTFCENGGKCSEIGGETKCVCPAGYRGTYCSGMYCFHAFYLNLSTHKKASLLLDAMKCGNCGHMKL